MKSLRNTDDDVNNQEEAVEVLSDAAKTEATDWFDNLHNTSELTLFDDLFAINLNNSLSRYDVCQYAVARDVSTAR